MTRNMTHKAVHSQYLSNSNSYSESCFILLITTICVKSDVHRVQTTYSIYLRRHALKTFKIFDAEQKV
jgi:hypothetical protein